jgi:TolB protein
MHGLGRKQTATWLSAVLLGLAAAALGACGQPATGTCGIGGLSPHPDIGGQLVYSCSSGVAIKGDLFVLDLTSGHVRRLTDDGSYNTDPAWSPDGSRIVFESTRRGRSDLYLMDVTATRVSWLTGGAGFNEQPRWSPDGAWISFTSSRDGISAPVGVDGFHRDVYLVRPDGSGLHRLTVGVGFNGDVAWAADGTHLAFTSDRAGAFDIYVMNPDGTGQRQLTHHEGGRGFAAYATWSPDGSLLAFNATNPTGDPALASLYTIDVAGRGGKRITRGYDFHPNWSPESRWIAFLGSRGGHSQLFAVRPDGSDLTELTTDPSDKDVPRWRPQ